MQNTTTMNRGTRARMDVRKMVTMAMLVAIGVALVYFVHFPIMPAAPFLEYDPADVPILLGTLLYGPVAGLLMTVAVSLIQALTVSVASGPIGFIMHVAATGAMVSVAGAIHVSGKKRSITRTTVGLVCGAVAMTIVMMGMNLILTPIFMGRAVGEVVQMLVPVLIPFNAIKAGLNSALAFLLYKGLERVLPTTR